MYKKNRVFKEIDKELITSLEKIPYARYTRFEMPEYLLELYIEYVRVKHRVKKEVISELNKKLDRPASDKLCRKRVAEYESNKNDV
jgi:hypothetical protein